jgi:F0F1-type ATP synthase assembly protein I
MKNDDEKNRYDSSIWSGFAVPGQVVAYILGGAALGFLAGHFIDDRLHSSPIATLIGLLLGLAAGIFGIVRLVSSLK